ncbi:response regulator [Flavobacterium sp. NG2]|uniref:response regulator n=1 Tax=Flavobacterium sp. NG2 TaxID=3097547 RepID=UPI002A8411A2|nr:response regulator [Flavobacterium sp. NG2]WPR70653.1 response regulator [Flavobacterium sp. NG2]
MKKKSIWLIDDDAIYKIVMKKIISNLGLLDSTTTFSNGEEAIKALVLALENQTNIPDVILLDIEMPIMDGWGFMEEFQKIESDIKRNIIIYISSSSIAFEDKNKAKNNKLITGYMSKPIKKEDLALII